MMDRIKIRRMRDRENTLPQFNVSFSESICKISPFRNLSHVTKEFANPLFDINLDLSLSFFFFPRKSILNVAIIVWDEFLYSSDHHLCGIPNFQHQLTILCGLWSMIWRGVRDCARGGFDAKSSRIPPQDSHDSSSETSISRAHRGALKAFGRVKMYIFLFFSGGGRDIRWLVDTACFSLERKRVNKLFFVLGCNPTPLFVS